MNRVARPFYAEALRLAEEQAASPATIDAVLTQAGGFRMGPFALMDLVGQDVNEAVTRSVWTAFGYDPRFAPSLLQRAMVEAGWLGRKTGRGWFRYGDDAAPPDPGRRAGPPGRRRYVTEHGESPLRVLLGRSGRGDRRGRARATRDGTGRATQRRAGWCAATAGPRPRWRPSGAARWWSSTGPSTTPPRRASRSRRRDGCPAAARGRGHRAAAGGRPDGVRDRRRSRAWS